MILIDNSQILISSIFQSLKDTPTIDDDFIRHIVLNTYRMIRKRFHREYGELVICSDSPNPWRKDIFPLYKQNRKEKQKSSGMDWDQIYRSMKTIRDEIMEVFPYKNIKIDNAEADDIIAILARHYHTQEKILIVSNDKDFQQLQIFPSVQQYSTFNKNYLVCSNPALFLCEHIARGDASDGIPNILSTDSSIVDKDKRQNRLTKKTMADIMSVLENIDTSKYATNWNRNKKLIDFSSIPSYIEDNILEMFAENHTHSGTILNYMIEHKLVNLLPNIEEFS